MKKLIYSFIFLIIFSCTAFAQNDVCLDCHSDDSLTMGRNGKDFSLFVNEEHYGSSIHADMECVDCHEDFDPEELPHKDGEFISKVACNNCHEIDDFKASIHAQKKLDCYSCHTKHSIQEASTLKEQGNNFCTTCHNESKVKGFAQSVHNTQSEETPNCVDCHGTNSHDIASADFSEDKLHEICSTCHDEAVKNFESSLHGTALTKGKFLAPNCITCHNSHKIIASDNPESKTYKLNIPQLCGDCHKDGTKVSEMGTISQRHILENYSESIHGEGLLKRGLFVTAVCTNCHFSHNILPHENPNSSINRKNIATTCTQCHVRIEQVHTKVIDGELWEKEPHKIPACIDCHQPHEVRRVFYEDNYTNQLCISCHSKDDIYKTVNGEKISLKIDPEVLSHSAHKENSCVKCHTNVSVSNKPICINSGPVDCSSCHAELVDKYSASIHGQLRMEGNAKAPYCTDCHGTHEMLPRADLKSPTSRRNIPELCASCHASGMEVQLSSHTGQTEFVNSYAMSIHGKGLLESGLSVTATCIDCHSSHEELPASNPLSTVNHENIAETCAQCHTGIYEQFRYSIHSPDVSDSDKKLPSCSDCHQSHSIGRTDKIDFRESILSQCGDCHQEVTSSYFETFHGKVSQLGSDVVAKCQDCHGAHNIMPTYSPSSTLHRDNIVETCKSCHPNSNKKFVGYLTHATHHDKDKYPVLYYTFWAMTILLVTTFAFFGLHTLLWLPRALAEKKKHNKEKNGRQ